MQSSADSAMRYGERKFCEMDAFPWSHTMVTGTMTARTAARRSRWSSLRRRLWGSTGALGTIRPDRVSGDGRAIAAERAPVAGGLVQPHGRDRSTATSGNSSGEP